MSDTPLDLDAILADLRGKRERVLAARVRELEDRLSAVHDEAINADDRRLRSAVLEAVAGRDEETDDDG